MAGDRERLEELRARARYEDLKARSAAQPEESMMDKAGDFGKSMIMGSSIGEQMPGGKTIADAGTAIGSGIVAATTTAPGEGYLDRLKSSYGQSMNASNAAESQRSAIDAKSPMAMGVKETMGELPMMAQARPSPLQAAETSLSSSPGWLSSGSKYSTGPIGGGDDPEKKAKLMEYFKTYGPAVADQAVELLPYPIRASIKAVKAVRKAGQD